MHIDDSTLQLNLTGLQTFCGIFTQITPHISLTRSKLTQHWISLPKFLSNHRTRATNRTNRINKFKMVIWKKNQSLIDVIRLYIHQKPLCYDLLRFRGTAGKIRQAKLNMRNTIFQRIQHSNTHHIYFVFIIHIFFDLFSDTNLNYKTKLDLKRRYRCSSMNPSIASANTRRVYNPAKPKNPKSSGVKYRK